MPVQPLCLVGAGRIARVHAGSIARSHRARLAAVVDPDPAARADIAAAHGAQAFATLDEALAAGSFAGIVIASPTGTHADYVEACVEARLPVLCEKPVDLTLARVDRCLERIAGCGVPVTVGFHRRADAARREVKADVAQGRIGRPEHALLVSRDRLPPPPAYIAHSGGIVRDMLIHDLDEIVWLFGDGPLSVTAELRPFEDPALAGLGDHGSAAVTIAYDDGPVCHVVASRRCTYGFEQRIEVFGSLGLTACPSLPARHATLAGGAGFVRPPLHESFRERYAAAYEAELDAFLDMAEGRAPPLCPVDEARMSLALAELVIAAHRSGGRVRSTGLGRAAAGT
ncbi:Gfo/Idh/MocA family oxidoreductase [Labrys wisconsinensis]|uniref:Myo-inositol 2-dehydrogenase/D-chiro-inositol 1-dehydrogenase n=1 Tax=Labrys wisconsinensis TaxID=425677 RepID=A0ABU0JIB4_9HYPH|nr:Gfo/Idh/MocA family oxidoreductase [Labrys wisconsinensis]MDQ0474023.1 myo-inositol 2-dehydrogenase/D-chiro-inositol 1-dehydrogenase [Labrys wisconsinensis]